MKMSGMGSSLIGTLSLREGRNLRDRAFSTVGAVGEQISGWGARRWTFARLLSPSPKNRVAIFRPSLKGRADAGYTLVELLVVVAILGLLTLIATPFVLRYLDNAKVSTARTEIANI